MIAKKISSYKEFKEFKKIINSGREWDWMNNTKKMNKYFIYNKGEIFYFECETMDDAKQKAIMLADHSEEIIVREYTQIRNYIKPKKSKKR